VIRICYSSELQPGLHGRVERHGRRTFIYLLPGLTPQQRRAALRRMRQQGRMGIGPRLPAVQLAAALLADRVSTAFGQAGAIVRVHPAGSTLPVMAVSVAIASFLVLSALSVHIVHVPPQAAGGSTVVASAPAGRVDQPLPSPSGEQPVSPVSGAPSGRSSGASSHAVRPPAPGGIAPTPSGASGSNPVTGPVASPGPSRSPSPAPTEPSPGGSTLSSTAATTPPSQSPTPAVTPAGTSSPAASPSPSASAPPKSGHTDVCVDIGAFGICLGL
jgi:hypothetical protein